ncbi:4248_t:CDS:2 [Acaulospora morrowiae]|uniref:4248_t:CDS:1 n=1 Tax=Acaulospora morrowiae TaxID=94023 RepID=A0A9N9F3L4_9GLOM|nr:4248_t:CDS:2 [Acaulospora morrowiae]
MTSIVVANDVMFQNGRSLFLLEVDPLLMSEFIDLPCINDGWGLITHPRAFYVYKLGEPHAKGLVARRDPRISKRVVDSFPNDETRDDELFGQVQEIIGKKPTL